jgi:hypothetical protein
MDFKMILFWEEIMERSGWRVWKASVGFEKRWLNVKCLENNIGTSDWFG